MKKLRFLPIFLATLASSPAFAADQFYLGYSYWDYNVRGQYDRGGSSYALGDNYDPSNSSRALYRLRWDTGHTWWIPDLAASFGRIEVNGQQNVSKNTGLGVVSSTANASTNIRDLDITARWPWQLGWGRLSLGMTGKQLRGDILIRDNLANGTQTERIDATFPMAHAFLEVPLGSRLRVGAGGDWAALDGDQADNIVGMARLKVIGPLDLTGGWQRKHYKVHNNDYHLDARLQGWQFGAELAF
jgi:hypothetical protein